MFSALNRDRKQGLAEIFPDGEHERVMNALRVSRFIDRSLQVTPKINHDSETA
jgi:hypothetical protein